MECTELVARIEDLMAMHPDLDWTCAAQSVAMQTGEDERYVIETVREYFE